MCGIVGYLGEKNTKEILLDGLKELEYRGYDSAGIAVLQDGNFSNYKAVGKLINLEEKTKNFTTDSFAAGIGHTRWATHGKVTKENAHPHLDCKQKIAIVHNGIIENHVELRDSLKAKGHSFKSETDSEVIAHLIEEEMKHAQESIEKMTPEEITKMMKK